jgi:hypothetical protein
MNLKEYEQKKKEGFIKHWETKRKNRAKCALMQSIYFVLPFSIIFQLFESVQGFLTILWGFKFLTIFSIYFLLFYYVVYNRQEKKIKKSKKIVEFDC